MLSETVVATARLWEQLLWRGSIAPAGSCRPHLLPTAGAPSSSKRTHPQPASPPRSPHVQTVLHLYRFREKIMARVDDLLKQMRAQGASDLHLTSGSAPYMRIDGELVKQNYKNVSPEPCQSVIFEILAESQRETFLEKMDLDFSYPRHGVGRFRVNVFMQRHGIAACFRLIPENIKTLKELNLAQQLAELINVSEGLILVTGPTGSGKSRTLSYLIREINVQQQAHIITVEDPIEFVHENQNCLISQREVASHTQSFATALRAALREDPDIILVGEMRDLETISLAITAAETGHLVFGTLHTNNAIKTVDRMIDVFPEMQQTQIRVMLAESLRAVVSQALLPRPDDQE